MNISEGETKYVGFCYAVEHNAIMYDDKCFETLTSDVLDTVAKYQCQSDSDTYCSEWQSKIGQLVYIYDACRGRMFEDRVFLDSSTIGVECPVDFRIADKESLIVSAGRQLARYLYTGSGDIAQIAEYCSIAMMLYLRSGQTKYDMYSALDKECMRTIHQLLDSADVDIPEVLSGQYRRDDSLYHRSQFSVPALCPTDIIMAAKETADNIPDTAFHLVDDEMVKIKKNEDLYDDDDENLHKLIGKYVCVYRTDTEVEDTEGHYTLEQLHNLTDNDDLFFDTTEDVVSYLEEFFDDEFLTNYCDVNGIINVMAEGIALFCKNGKTAQDYLHAFCAELDKYGRNSVADDTPDKLKRNLAKLLVRADERLRNNPDAATWTDMKLEELKQQYPDFFERTKDKTFCEMTTDEIGEMLFIAMPDSLKEKIRNLCREDSDESEE